MTLLKSIARRLAPQSYSKLQERRTKSLLKKVTARILERYGPVVQDGPFADMKFVSEASNSSVVPKIVGSYESELQDIIRGLVSDKYDAIINIGCAEGYYAVGLARLFPSASVHAFDLDPLARRLCAEMAAANELTVAIHGECTAQLLNELVTKFGRALIVCDCEGAEVQILDPSVVNGLSACDMLVELHDFVDPTISGTIQARFQDSHEVRIIDSQPRNPAEFSAASFLSPLEQRVAVSEFRPNNMQWAFMRAKEAKIA
jgi:hypothetical protein